MSTSFPIPAWHESPEARALLAELGANPPATRTAHYAFGESAEVYTDKLPNGYREGRPVRTLNKLYRDHGDKLLGDTGPHRVLIRSTKRKCPTCGTAGCFAPAPTAMIEARDAKNVAREALFQSLLAA
jgi:hypothetical protein